MKVSAPGANFRPHPLRPGLVTLLALTTGVAAANVYYAQPLLELIGESFGVSAGTAGLLVALTQLGYLLGIALVVPLGDLLERRRLIVVCLGLAALAASLCAAAPAFAVLGAALVALGLTSVVAQIIVPLASTLAAPEQRGQIVGTVMSGLLIGILAARVVSGLVAELAGWRGVYALAAVMLIVLALQLRRELPPVPPPASASSYGATLRSVLELIGAEPVLRQRMAITFCSASSFAIFWTSLTFLLSDPPFEYSEGVIGLFGLAGISGAAIAPLAGRFVDRGHARLAITGFLVLLVVSWGTLAFGAASLAPLLIGIVLLDLATQGILISNQVAVYALRPEARSRLNTALMVATFTGMIPGSVLASLTFESGGWTEVCAIGGGSALAALAVWGLTRRIAPRPLGAVSGPGSAPG